LSSGQCYLNKLGLVDVNNKVFLFLKQLQIYHLDGQWTDLDRQGRNSEGQWKAQNVLILTHQLQIIWMDSGQTLIDSG